MDYDEEAHMLDNPTGDDSYGDSHEAWEDSYGGDDFGDPNQDLHDHTMEMEAQFGGIGE